MYVQKHSSKGMKRELPQEVLTLRKWALGGRPMLTDDTVETREACLCSHTSTVCLCRSVVNKHEGDL